MPNYEYKCQSCAEVFEVRQRFSDAPLVIHEKCGGKLERLISPSALRFKGSGWYVNDYGRKKSGGGGNGKGESKGESQGESKKPSSAPATTQSKPAADTAPSKS